MNALAFPSLMGVFIVNRKISVPSCITIKYSLLNACFLFTKMQYVLTPHEGSRSLSQTQSGQAQLRPPGNKGLAGGPAQSKDCRM